MHPTSVALVTGGGRGIGRGITEALLADGHALAINGVRDEDQVEGLDTLREKGPVLYCQGDISDATARQGILDRIRDEYGRLDILVNNAGVAPKVRADLLDAGEESFEWVLKVNLQLSLIHI